MERIRIENTDIIFDESGNGKGKIIISNDDFGYTFSYYWGSMGCSLKKFLISIDSDYFVKKLSHNYKGNFNTKKTFSLLRKYIQDCFKYELPWYLNTEFQKNYRIRLKEIQEKVFSEETFISEILDFHKKLDYSLIKDKNEILRIEKLFSDIFYNCEPWRFSFYDKHYEDIFLEKLHGKIIKSLSNPVQLCLF